MNFLQDLCPLPKDGLQSGLQLHNNCGQAKAAETEVTDVWLFGPGSLPAQYNTSQKDVAVY